MAGVGVLANVRQRFLADMEQRQSLGLRQVQLLRRALQGNFDQRVGAELGDQPVQAIHQVFFVQLARAQIEDIGADIADGAVQII